MMRKNNKLRSSQAPSSNISAVHQAETSAGSFLLGLLLVTVLVTPALIALSPYTESLTIVVVTSPFIVAFLAICSAGGTFLYERYGLKDVRFSWLSVFFTYVLPGTILNILGFASVVRLLPKVSSSHDSFLAVFVAASQLSFVVVFFLFFALVLVKPTTLDSRKRIGIIILIYSTMSVLLVREPRLSFLPATVAGAALGLLFANLLGKWVGPKILALRSLWPYIHLMLAPTATFILGYLMIAFIFAGSMGLLYRFDHTSFSGLVGEEPSFFAFFYYTTVTMTTVGYGDIAPASSLARLLSTAAAMTALCWVTVVFAAVIAFLQPRFSRILKETRSA